MENNRKRKKTKNNLGKLQLYNGLAVRIVIIFSATKKVSLWKTIERETKLRKLSLRTVKIIFELNKMRFFIRYPLQITQIKLTNLKPIKIS